MNRLPIYMDIGRPSRSVIGIFLTAGYPILKWKGSPHLGTQEGPRYTRHDSRHSKDVQPKRFRARKASSGFPSLSLRIAMSYPARLDIQ